MPRLELLSAVLCSKLVHGATDACNFYVKQYLWSDSMIVLHWIKRSPTELKMYVANRIQLIRENARHATWSHVATAENPADLVSRGINTTNFVKSDLWKHGPFWHSQPQNAWPKSRLTVTPRLQAEIKKIPSISLTLFALTLGQNFGSKSSPQMKPIDLHLRTNNLRKLLRITAYVLRFIEYARLKRKDLWNRGELVLPFELHNAANFWTKYAQSLAANA